jgi:hypothetical protein
MRKKALFVMGALAVMVIFQSCSSHPEKGLLEKYFNAVSLKDNQTMSSMALEPIEIDINSWELISVTPESIDPVILPDLNKKELDLKKAEEDHRTPVLEAQDLLYAAKDELDLARTGAARNAARKKVDALQAQYDEEYAKHGEIRKEYNDAKTAAAQEEQTAIFSLGLRELPGIRDFTGNVHAKEVDLKVNLKDGTQRTYRAFLRMYQLKDEATGMNHRGRWIITHFDQID